MKSPLLDLLQASIPLSVQDQACILDHFQERKVKKETILFKGDSVCRELFFISQGVLRLGIINDEGLDITYFFLKENQFCTILKSFNEEEIAGERIVAACDAQIWSITRQRLDELYGKLPWLKPVLDNILQRQLLEKIKTRNAFRGRDARGNYLALLQDAPDILLRVSLKDIASYLGITQQSLSRLRRDRH